MVRTSSKATPPSQGILKAHQTIWVCAALAALTLLVFWRVQRCDFISYDDPDYVTENTHVQKGLTGETIWWAFTRLHGEHTYWHPLTWLSHALDCELFGLNPKAHHLMNLGWHAANTVLLFLVLLRLSGAVWVCAAAAALWAVHPLQVDTVAWVTERKNLLSAFFWLASLWLYVGHARKPGWRRLAGVVAAMALGLMCKPAIVVLPLVLLLLDIWPLRRHAWARQTETASAFPSPPLPPEQTARTLLVEKIPFFVLAGISSLITLVGHQRLDNTISVDTLSISLRLQHAAVSYLAYLGKFFWPSDLAVYYPHPLHHPAGLVLAAVAFLIGVTVISLAWRQRLPYLLPGWGWFVVGLLPVIGIVQAGTQGMADRFMYLPLAGLAMLTAWGGRDLLLTWGMPQRWLWLPALVVVMILSLVSNRQVRHWQNSGTLFAHASEVTHENFLAFAALGAYRAEQGQAEEAQACLRRALKIRPSYSEAHIALGDALMRTRQFGEAAQHYQAAITIAPRLTEAHNGLGVALLNLGKPAESIPHFEAALQIEPQFGRAKTNLDLAQRTLNQNQTSEQALRQRVQDQPTSAEAWLALGNHLVSQHRNREALDNYQKALQQDGQSIAALNRCAWLMATTADDTARNGAEALRLAKKACDLTNNDPRSLLTLAAAQAELGQFAEAIATSSRAREQAIALGQTGLTNIIGNLEAEYRLSRPHREP
jgi:cytochrome c-type biogenesis protein CcmH/NrfG